MLKIPQKPLPLPVTPMLLVTSRHKPVGFPYIQGLSEHLQRVFKKHNVSIYHRPWNTLRQTLVHPKDRVEIEHKCDVVYQITWPDCNSVYIGETSRSFGQRFKEHCKTEGSNLSAVGEHCARTKHKLDLKSCKILDSDEGYHSRKIREALHIRQVKPSLNRDGVVM
jgi:hypothetical protein